MAKTQSYPEPEGTRAHLRKYVTIEDEHGKPVLNDGEVIKIDVGYLVDDEQLTDLERVEREHGFTFGIPEDGFETAGGTRSFSVSCSNKDCPQVNRPVDLHDDTVLPVMCGGCGGVLHCLHEDSLTFIHHEGDLANPRKITREVCIACQTQLSRTSENLPAIAIENIPLHLLGGLDIDTIAAAAQTTKDDK